jgi:hypothetical protein
MKINKNEENPIYRCGSTIVSSKFVLTGKKIPPTTSAYNYCILNNLIQYFSISISRPLHLK